MLFKTCLLPASSTRTRAPGEQGLPYLPVLFLAGASEGGRKESQGHSSGSPGLLPHPGLHMAPTAVFHQAMLLLKVFPLWLPAVPTAQQDLALVPVWPQCCHLPLTCSSPVAQTFLLSLPQGLPFSGPSDLGFPKCQPLRGAFCEPPSRAAPPSPTDSVPVSLSPQYSSLSEIPYCFLIDSYDHLSDQRSSP